MRISKIDLQCEDIMWFAVDSQKHIVECTSAGCGNDGEYVNYYTKISQPKKPLLYDELPELVKEKLIDNIIDINVSKESILNVENAY